jgi:hypothetical protein
MIPSLFTIACTVAENGVCHTLLDSIHAMPLVLDWFKTILVTSDSSVTVLILEQEGVAFGNFGIKKCFIWWSGCTGPPHKIILLLVISSLLPDEHG